MRVLLLALSAAMLLAACTGGEDSPSPSPSASSPTATSSPADDGTETGLELSETCTLTAEGVEVAVPYPAGWHTNATDDGGSATRPCWVFHHEPFTLPENSEVVGYDYFVRVEEVPYQRVTAGDDPAHELLSTTETEVAGLPATVQELRATEDGISGPEGARHYLYAVDLGDGRTLIAVTYEVGDLDYARNKDLLDRVMQEITIAQGDAVAH